MTDEGMDFLLETNMPEHYEPDWEPTEDYQEENMAKDLKDVAVDIKGKKYVLVSDRVVYFNETYQDGSIETELISDWNNELVVVKATVSPDGKRKFTGYSQATVGDGYINKTSALENAETSAVGRALGFMGIGVIESIASADELKKASWNSPYPKPPTRQERIDSLSPLETAKGDLFKRMMYEEGITANETSTVVSAVLGKDKVTSLEDVDKVNEYLDKVKEEVGVK